MDCFSCHPFTITMQDFRLFHSIDRLLFSTLIHTLGRDISESMHIVAFLIWLERVRYSHNAVKKLLDWPLHLLNQLSNEILSCLKYIEGDKVSYTWYNDLSLLRKLCTKHVSLYHFHENGDWVIKGVSKIVADVCVRVFEDIIFQHNNGGEGGSLAYANPRFAHLGLGGNMDFQNFVPRKFENMMMREDLDTDLSEIFGEMKLVDGCEDEEDVEPDDRTIFLTFSKGYYIAECEIRDFFTRIFGDFIEAIYMQEVSPNEQPLYARMVARSSAIIPAIAPANSKAKYSINGKHIWAKKYVKKNRRTTSSPEPNSLVEATSPEPNSPEPNSPVNNLEN